MIMISLKIILKSNNLKSSFNIQESRIHRHPGGMAGIQARGIYSAAIIEVGGTQ